MVYQACKEVVYSESPIDLIREGYWPGAAERRSQYIFDQQLFKFYDLLQKTILGFLSMDFTNTQAIFRIERKGNKL